MNSSFHTLPSWCRVLNPELARQNAEYVKPHAGNAPERTTGDKSSCLVGFSNTLKIYIVSISELGVVRARGSW